jgi:hypothetical protein
LLQCLNHALHRCRRCTAIIYYCSTSAAFRSCELLYYYTHEKKLLLALVLMWREDDSRERLFERTSTLMRWPSEEHHYYYRLLMTSYLCCREWMVTSLQSCASRLEHGGKKMRGRTTWTRARGEHDYHFCGSRGGGPGRLRESEWRIIFKFLQL